MKLNTHPENRKEMVKAISELTGLEAVYMFTPTYAFKIGTITVNRDGTTDCEDETMIEAIKPMLIEHGWTLKQKFQLIQKKFRKVPNPSALSRWRSPCRLKAGRFLS